MSEVQSRPAAPRGRGSARGGRGGGLARSARGGRGHATNGDKLDNSASASIEESVEVAQLKKKYGDRVTTIKEMFPDWTDEDICLALEETDGDLMTAVDRITDGSLTQWGEVSKTKKDRSKSKVKDAPLADSSNQTSRVSRGGRAGSDGTRGGRGRGVDRGRGGRARGPSAAHTNGSHTKENAQPSIPTTESGAWDTTTEATPDAPSWDSTKPVEETSGGWGSTAVETAANVTSSIIPDGVKKSWASMFAKPPPASKKAPEAAEKPVEPTKPEEPTETPAVEPEAAIPEPAPIEPEVLTPVALPTVEEPEVNITPSKDDLTEDNLELIPDTSNPAPTATAASTAASSWDPRNASTAGTPYSALQNQPQAIRPPTSGFQASALKATGTSGRTPSFQRRVLDQEEAVRMPSNREVDRTAVQFGAFSLNGSGEEDVDGEREEPETRAQPPQHSPVAPRAALPPAPVSAAETYPTPKQSAGLPAATHPTAAPGLPSPQPLQSAQSAQGSAPFNQYARYGQQGSQESTLPQKPYDAFSQQAPSAQSPFEGYPSQQAQSQSQQQSSAPDQFSSYYTADPSRNAAYQNYYQQQYNLQQGSQGQQDSRAPRDAMSGYYNAPEAAAQATHSAAQQASSRYATAGGEGSGHNTPNPTSQAQQQGASQGSQAQQQPGHPQQPQAGNYPFNHPYYSSPYYSTYMQNQYQQYGGGNYGAGPYGAKGGMHQPYQGYGMSPAGAPYEHASSPAAGGFGGSSAHGRDSALSGGLGEYGRAGSAQPAQTPQGLAGSAAYGGGHDPFARGSSFPAQNQQHYGGNQNNQAGSTDDLKPFGDSKTTNGPSPSLSQANRPGSAANNAPGSGLPPPQSQQGGYGGYPGHLQQQLHNTQASSYGGGLGGAAGHQAAGQGHQGSQQYGGYQGFGGYPYGNNQQQQQQQQQRGGWGGNYGGH